MAKGFNAPYFVSNAKSPPSCFTSFFLSFFPSTSKVDAPSLADVAEAEKAAEKDGFVLAFPYSRTLFFKSGTVVKPLALPPTYNKIRALELNPLMVWK